MKISRLFLIAFGLLGLVAAPAMSRADFVIVKANNPQVDENVLLTSGEVGHTITGETNTTHAGVLITSAAQVLTSPSSGQARVEAQSGSLLGLDSINLLAGATYTSLIFNLFSGSGDAVFTINGFDANGNAESITSSAFALGNGQNFFTITAINGERISSVGFTSAGGVTDVRQIRIGGVAAAVPEPASVAMLGLGAGALGLVGVARRRRATTV
ncbi:PEP-CTERM sorting domain-containing protein [Planctomyces sp. SH-PL62]|uniref:PEP-CTERM sorting domain-containing protein n=1 Tax=Planctomyces sp. SH-PL62 TaxID=1636152 RepID=UPI00078BBB3C|nr:PEP-CTERM sorting domain-containing protein [Planctomyces sp. SH-PL62]AMV37680.1 PEP-CTERM motif protein [Planctomyces sp. SH-PL62]